MPTAEIAAELRVTERSVRGGGALGKRRPAGADIPVTGARCRARLDLPAGRPPRHRAGHCDAGLWHLGRSLVTSLASGNPAYTRYLTHLHTGDRSKEAIDAGGVLPGYADIIARDGYKGYEHLTDALHAWCAAHILRAARQPPGGNPGSHGDRVQPGAYPVRRYGQPTARRTGG